VYVLDGVLDREDVTSLGRVDPVDQGGQRGRFPAPGRSGDEDQALGVGRELPEAFRKTDVRQVGHFERDEPEDRAHPLALEEDIRSEAAERGILVAEVELLPLVEHGAPFRRQGRADPLLELRRGGLGHREGREISVHADVRNRTRR